MMKPVSGRRALSWILSLVDSTNDDDDMRALSAGPNTKPIPKVAMMRPMYLGRSFSLETSATQLCITGNIPPNIPIIIMVMTFLLTIIRYYPTLSLRE